MMTVAQTQLNFNFSANQNFVADVLEFALDLGAVLAGHRLLSLLRLGFDGGNHAPRGSSGTNDVLVRHGEQVALLVGQLNTELGDGLHGLGHIIVSLGLLSKLGLGNSVVSLSHGESAGIAVKFTVEKHGGDTSLV